MVKDKKKIKNWSEYNKSLVARGGFNLWFEEDILDEWYHKEGRVGKGRANIYSDKVIELMVVISESYTLPYRQTEGFKKGSDA